MCFAGSMSVWLDVHDVDVVRSTGHQLQWSRTDPKVAAETTMVAVAKARRS